MIQPGRGRQFVFTLLGRINIYGLSLSQYLFSRLYLSQKGWLISKYNFHTHYSLRNEDAKPTMFYEELSREIWAHECLLKSLEWPGYWCTWVCSQHQPTENLENRKFALKSLDNKLHSWNIIFPIKKESYSYFWRSENSALKGLARWRRLRAWWLHPSPHPPRRNSQGPAPLWGLIYRWGVRGLFSVFSGKVPMLP